MDDYFISAKEKEISMSFTEIIGELRELKSEERTERDRRIAIAITEVEKAYAYFKTFVFTSNSYPKEKETT